MESEKGGKVVGDWTTQGAADPPVAVLKEWQI